ncbi:hypothetical protein CSOJ01_15560 [Colletotrichum sojae]|uniref:Uncharacterized protein n=1 Tax=Colletotrichum sojae TaxID=2175907 RepID=A0A8H6IMK8_9PEZI|nr:hypothetical protein CSOJ01_15560 [Colletotrichum sojae]
MGGYQSSDAYIWYYNEGGLERRPDLPALEIGDQNRALLIPGEVYCRFSKDGGNTLCPEDHRLNIAEPVHNIRTYYVDQAIGGTSALKIEENKDR